MTKRFSSSYYYRTLNTGPRRRARE